MKRKFVLTAVCCGMMLSACSKKADSSSKEETGNSSTVAYQLNERQKALLKELELPEDYDQLTLSQKNAIEKIELGLSYLEEKYNEKFVYTGYVEGGIDGEYLTVFRDTDVYQNTITVKYQYENEQFTFTDDYDLLIAQEEYKKAVAAYLDETAVKGHYLDVVSVFRVDEGEDSILSRASSNSLIFIEDIFESENEVKEFVDKYLEWLGSYHKNYDAIVKFCVISSDDFKETNLFNYSDQFRNVERKYYYNCSVSKDGTIKFVGEN